MLVGLTTTFIVNTHERKLDSKLAIDLKKLTINVLKCKEEGVGMYQIREEVFPKPPPSRHVYVRKAYTDRFYFLPQLLLISQYDWQICHC